MDLTTQRQFEITHQAKVLRQEFAAWRARTGSEAAWQKHFTQLQRITTQLGAFIDSVAGSPAPAAHGGGPPAGPAEPADPNTAFSRLVFAHRVWSYYRALFTQREVTALRRELRCIDELAWACYQPARDKAVAAGTVTLAAVKEPPLVCFGNDASPYAQGRATLLDPHGQGISTVDIERFGQALLALPMPIVTVPWFQASHLPAAVLVAHEVGHAVDHDFGLSGVFEPVFQALNIPSATRRTAWLAWRAELFADVYGILCTGAAHVLALLSYLADAVDVVAGERITAADWGKYPSRHLRMQVNLAVLDRLGLPDEGTRALWSTAYPNHAMFDFESDVPKVVAAFLDTPLPAFGGARLPDVTCLTAPDWEKVRAQANRIILRQALEPGRPFNQLFAAATLAYHGDPPKYLARDEQLPILESLAASIPPGVRGTLPRQDQAMAQARADEAAGRALLALFATP